jgi:hypothetical protein
MSTSSSHSSSETSSNVNAERLQCHKETVITLNFSQITNQKFHEAKSSEPIDYSPVKMLEHLQNLLDKPFHSSNIDFLRELRCLLLNIMIFISIIIEPDYILEISTSLRG